MLAVVVLVGACSDDAPGGLGPTGATNNADAATNGSTGVGGGSSNSSSSSSVGSGAGTPADLGGTFQIIKEGGLAQTFDYRLDDGELAFCKYYPDMGDYLWVRLAEDAASGGDQGPHLDIDVCGYEGTGAVTAMDPYGGGCTGAAGWDVWWHELQFSSFVNTADADPCTLQLNVVGDVLYGSFECVPLILGDEQLELRNGEFACQVEEL